MVGGEREIEIKARVRIILFVKWWGFRELPIYAHIAHNQTSNSGVHAYIHEKCPLLLALNTINFNCIISMCNLNYEYFSVKENWGEKKNYCKKCLWSSMSQDSSSTICIQSMTQLLEVICDQDMFSKGDSNMNDRFLQLHKFFCLFQLVFFCAELNLSQNALWIKICHVYFDTQCKMHANEIQFGKKSCHLAGKRLKQF